MIVDTIFPTYVFRKQCNLDLERLENKCLEFQKKVPSSVKSSVGGYQGYDFYDEDLFLEIKSSVPILENKNLEVVSDNTPENPNTIFPSFWVNINGPGAYNVMHNHAPYHGVFLSGVFYVKTPDNCGNIQLIDPRLSICNSRDMTYYNDGNTHHYYTAKENLLLIFPPWLYHTVDPNKSDENRISISFNLSVSK